MRSNTKKLTPWCAQIESRCFPNPFGQSALLRTAWSVGGLLGQSVLLRTAWPGKQGGPWGSRIWNLRIVLKHQFWCHPNRCSHGGGAYWADAPGLAATAHLKGFSGKSFSMKILLKPTPQKITIILPATKISPPPPPRLFATQEYKTYYASTKHITHLQNILRI